MPRVRPTTAPDIGVLLSHCNDRNAADSKTWEDDKDDEAYLENGKTNKRQQKKKLVTAASSTSTSSESARPALTKCTWTLAQSASRWSVLGHSYQ